MNPAPPFWLDNHILDKVFPAIFPVTIRHRASLSHRYWLYSPCCASPPGTIWYQLFLLLCSLPSGDCMLISFCRQCFLGPSLQYCYLPSFSSNPHMFSFYKLFPSDRNYSHSFSSHTISDNTQSLVLTRDQHPKYSPWISLPTGLHSMDVSLANSNSRFSALSSIST